MIPQIIHYCWFGKGEMPNMAKNCIASWEKYLPNYRRVLWNESNFDVTEIPYVREAYEARKYAFVTDYVRLYALHKYGGIYMDTDVEVVRNFDSLLDLPAFSGFESDHFVPTGIMASQIGGKWIEELLTYYTDRHFKNPQGDYDLTTNTQVITKLMEARGLALNNTYQLFDNCVHIFPSEYFSPKKYGKVIRTENTYCIHHFAGSWKSPAEKRKLYFYRKFLGSNITYFLVNAKKWFRSYIKLL